MPDPTWRRVIVITVCPDCRTRERHVHTSAPDPDEAIIPRVTLDPNLRSLDED